ncbi:MAG TPA: hypothetical protein GX521_00450, partial [Firmicutes bacterium]|nr:hypothetical protein [Bacillota bacterium]
MSAKKKRGIKSREIIGILLLAFSVFSIFALYVDTAGWVGLTLRGVLRIAFGDLAVLFTVLIFFVSLHIFRGKRWPPSLRKILGLALLVFEYSIWKVN